MKADEVLGQLDPNFVLTGSVVESTRFCHATEIDVCVSFAALAKSYPFRLDSNTDGKIRDAMKVFAPVGVKHFERFTKQNSFETNGRNEDDQEHVTTSQIFDFPKFLYYFLTFIKKSLLKLSSRPDWPEKLRMDYSWKPSNKCCIKERNASSSDHSKSLYNPHTHCSKCRPFVTHTKIGATPIFTWKDDETETVLTADFIPVFPVESSQGFLPLFYAIVSTLAREAPKGGNKHFKSIMEKDRILPESFQDLLEKQHTSRPRKTYDVSMKLLNYGSESNYIIRPGQIKDDRQAKAVRQHPQKKIEEVINEVYISIKGLKSILGVDVDSYFIKKVVRLKEITHMILDLDAAKVGLPRKVFDVLDLPELRDHFKKVIDYKGWQEKLEGEAFNDDDRDKIPIFLNNLPKLKMDERLQIEEYERHGFFA